MGVSLTRIVQFTMKVFSLVLLVVASVQCEAEADAYTFRQVAYGLTNGGFITGVDYGHGLVTGYGALGNRGHYGHYPGLHYYGKREAEAGAAPYTHTRWLLVSLWRTPSPQ